MQSRLVADTLVDSDRQPRPTQVANFNDYHQRNWDSIRGFIAVHYKFNERLETPFWRACRADTVLGRAEPIVEYYRENGPTSLWQPTLFDDFDGFKMGGYASMLVGMRVPYKRTHTVTEAERRVWEGKRKRFKEVAQRAMGVREAWDVVTSARWRWV